MSIGSTRRFSPDPNVNTRVIKVSSAGLSNGREREGGGVEGGGVVFRLRGAASVRGHNASKCLAEFSLHSTRTETKKEKRIGREYE